MNSFYGLTPPLQGQECSRSKMSDFPPVRTEDTDTPPSPPPFLANYCCRRTSWMDPPVNYSRQMTCPKIIPIKWFIRGLRLIPGFSFRITVCEIRFRARGLDCLALIPVSASQPLSSRCLHFLRNSMRPRAALRDATQVRAYHQSTPAPVLRVAAVLLLQDRLRVFH